MKTNDIDRIINLGYEVSVCLENDLSLKSLFIILKTRLYDMPQPV